MWLYRGAQSALFYYISCTPCTDAAYRRKRRRQAERDWEEQKVLEQEQPDLYTNHGHMAPFRTNPFWDEEIRLGPGPPPKRSGKKNANSCNQRGTSGTGVGSDRDFAGAEGEDRMRATPSEDSVDEDNWNRRRYQREDEELWGRMEYLSLSSRSATARSANVDQNGSLRDAGSFVASSLDVTMLAGLTRPSTSRTGRSVTTASVESRSYFMAGRAPVNDLHPPVVSTPSARADDMRWMIQPPPRAGFMSGKEREIGGSIGRGGRRPDMLSRSLTGRDGGSGSRVSIPRRRTSQTLVLDENWGTDDAPIVRPSLTISVSATTSARQFPQTPPNRQKKRRPRRVSMSSTSSDCSSLDGSHISPSASFNTFTFPQSTRPNSKLSQHRSSLSQRSASQQPLSHASLARPKLGSRQSSHTSSRRSARGTKRKDSKNLLVTTTTNNSISRARATPSPAFTTGPDSYSSADDSFETDDEQHHLRLPRSRQSRRATSTSPAPSPNLTRANSARLSHRKSSKRRPRAQHGEQQVQRGTLEIIIPNAMPVSAKATEAISKDNLGRADSGTTCANNGSGSKCENQHVIAAEADASTLAVLERLVDPAEVAKSRFSAAPVVEARIGLPDDADVGLGRIGTLGEMGNRLDKKRWSCDV